jgi:hypothetical protein
MKRRYVLTTQPSQVRKTSLNDEHRRPTSTVTSIDTCIASVNPLSGSMSSPSSSHGTTPTLSSDPKSVLLRRSSKASLKSAATTSFIVPAGTLSDPATGSGVSEELARTRVRPDLSSSCPSATPVSSRSVRAKDRGKLLPFPRLSLPSIYPLPVNYRTCELRDVWIHAHRFLPFVISRSDDELARSGSKVEEVHEACGSVSLIVRRDEGMGRLHRLSLSLPQGQLTAHRHRPSSLLITRSLVPLPLQQSTDPPKPPSLQRDSSQADGRQTPRSMLDTQPAQRRPSAMPERLQPNIHHHRCQSFTWPFFPSPVAYN